MKKVYKNSFPVKIHHVPTICIAPESLKPLKVDNILILPENVLLFSKILIAQNLLIFH